MWGLEWWVIITDKTSKIHTKAPQQPTECYMELRWKRVSPRNSLVVVAQRMEWGTKLYKKQTLIGPNLSQ